MTIKDLAFNLTNVFMEYYSREHQNQTEYTAVQACDKLFSSGIVQRGSLTPLDDKIYTVSIDEWNQILSDDWTKLRKFLADKMDCDDYAWQLKAEVNRRYGINSIGFCIGQRTPKVADRPDHCFNILLDNKLDLYVVEPQDGIIIKYVPGQDTIIKNYKYEVSTIIL